jgi:hypothetical protein
LLEVLPEESANTFAPDDDQPQSGDRGMTRWNHVPSSGHAHGNDYAPGISPG